MMEEVDFAKYSDGLVPAIIQDADTSCVLMLGFMNAESLELTRTSGKVTFFSRSRKTIWTKGEGSGNFLYVDRILNDCDSDTLLIKARPAGPVCHNGTDTCFGEDNTHAEFLSELERVLKTRKLNPRENSYSSRLFAAGINHIAQKLGEEAIELIIEAKEPDTSRIKEEAADLLFHIMVLLVKKEVEFSDVVRTLEQRSK